ELVSPEGISYSGEAEIVVCRTVGGGDIAFQPGHVPFIGELAVWQAEVVRSGGQRDVFAVHRGFVQVVNDQVTILSDMAEERSEIDVERARAAKERAEAALASNADDAAARAALARAEL